uniref:Uncharacterized protein n=1 Tax=Poecilia reticulata TaxID=8081 RepID=A0A3P9NJA6_POERE
LGESVLQHNLVFLQQRHAGFCTLPQVHPRQACIPSPCRGSGHLGILPAQPMDYWQKP